MSFSIRTAGGFVVAAWTGRSVTAEEAIQEFKTAAPRQNLRLLTEQEAVDLERDPKPLHPLLVRKELAGRSHGYKALSLVTGLLHRRGYKTYQNMGTKIWGIDRTRKTSPFIDGFFVLCKQLE